MNRKFYDSRDDTPEIEKRRLELHDACGRAFDETGSVRSPEWRAARAAITEFEREHGRLYNPD